MNNVFFILALISMAGVLASLFGGLLSMAKGSPKDNKTSNKMMRLRVLFQAFAILFLFLAFLTKK